MADSNAYFDLTIVTPFGVKEEFNIRHLKAPGEVGEFGVLKGHLPFITPLQIGEIELDTADGKKYWATSGGFAEVLPDRVTILAETAEAAEMIDIERAEEARQRAAQRIKEKSAKDIDYERARLSLFRAINRIKVVKHSR